ncbi:MAG: hypothetical protein LBB76_07080 [Azoarcus sp.]|jgi:hypothetical protein|nr:hypothetical protein [Azoarcus sp.]
MTTGNNAQDPLKFVRDMWGSMGFSLPGMMTPTLDVDELDKHITDMRAVEGWLKMNLNMLQMTIQGLDVQRAALAAVRAMSQHHAESAAEEPAANPFASAALWPWNVMNTTTPAETSVSPQTPATTHEPKAGSSRRKTTENK